MLGTPYEAKMYSGFQKRLASRFVWVLLIWVPGSSRKAAEWLNACRQRPGECPLVPVIWELDGIYLKDQMNHRLEAI